MPNEPAAAPADGPLPPSPGSAEALEIQSRFAELLERDPQAVSDATRDSGSHVVLNADDLFKRWPEYAAHPIARRWLGPLLYPVARKFIDRLYAELLGAAPTTGDTVVFTAGGGASGKSTVLRAQADRPEVDFVVDTTFSDPQRAIDQIETALRAGRQVEVNYVYRDFEDAVHGMIRRALDPKVGRIVPIDDLARTHFGAQRTILPSFNVTMKNRAWRSGCGRVCRAAKSTILPSRPCSHACSPTLTNSRNAGKLSLMKPSRKQFKVRLPNGEVFVVKDPSTKRLDPKLKKASDIRARSIVEGMKKAAAEAKRRGVPLSEILPVS
jgi:hypothetical protein